MTQDDTTPKPSDPSSAPSQPEPAAYTPYEDIPVARGLMTLVAAGLLITALIIASYHAGKVNGGNVDVYGLCKETEATRYVIFAGVLSLVGIGLLLLRPAVRP